MMKIYYRSVKEARLHTLDTFKAGTWINVYDPDEQDLKKIEKMLHVDKGLLHDALDPYEVPRLEREGGITYVFARVPKKDHNEIMTVPILVVVGDKFLLTISKERLDFLDDIINKRNDIFTTQKAKLFLEIFSSINRQYDLFIIGIGRSIRSLKVRLEKMSNKDLLYFVEFEKTLNDFLSSLTPTDSVLRKIIDGKSVVFYEEDRELIEDIFLGNGQMIEMTKSTLRHVVNIRSTYSNIITQELNRVMKILTSLTILLTIPTMIFSFYGMNVNLPHTHPSSYIFILILTVFVALSIFMLFKKNRWL